jgi:hypothetical protein
MMSTHPLERDSLAKRIFEEAKKEVAIKYGLGTTLVMGHKEKYWNEAAIIAMNNYIRIK